MSAISKFAGTGLLFIIIVVLGYFLSRSGKPYGLLAFTVHKLAALAVFAFLVVTVYQVQRAAPLNTLQIASFAIAAVFFIAAAVTGALLSIEKPMPVLLLKFHQVIPFLIMLSTTFTLYLVLIKNSAIAPGS